MNIIIAANALLPTIVFVKLVYTEFILAPLWSVAYRYTLESVFDFSSIVKQILTTQINNSRVRLLGPTSTGVI